MCFCLNCILLCFVWTANKLISDVSEQVNAMAKKYSYATLLKRKMTLTGRRSDFVCETMSNLVEDKDKIKDAHGSFENFGPFYDGSQEKSRLTPIPTPPPSPPRNRHRVTLEPEISQTGSLRPSSTLSLPAISGQFSTLPVPLYRSLPPVPSHPSSVPSSPISSPPSQPPPEFVERTKRLYVSNSPYILSSDSDSDEGKVFLLDSDSRRDNSG